MERLKRVKKRLMNGPEVEERTGGKGTKEGEERTGNEGTTSIVGRDKVPTDYSGLCKLVG